VGHRPPYIAVITLAVMTAHHWRTVRSKLLLAGIADPMGLRNMHMLLDTTESMILEAMSMSGDKDAAFKRSQFIDRLYSPANDVSNLNGDGYVAAPAGFEPENVEAAFDAFAAATSGAAV
jgi:hypothetical protein